jgi:hypothetical protein
MPSEKVYTFTIRAEVVGDDSKKMFDAHVAYENMKYEDVVLVEGALIKMFSGLNEFAVAQVSSAKK